MDLPKIKFILVYTYHVVLSPSLCGDSMETSIGMSKHVNFERNEADPVNECPV